MQGCTGLISCLDGYLAPASSFRALDIGMRRRAWAATGSPSRQYAVPGEPAKLVAASDGQRENKPEHCGQDQPEQAGQPPLIAQICSPSRKTR